ncbi:hypothetical protein Y032_0030g2225 [Ancylostoma ceylanicum]|uniref:Uncharacterized protein n=1 Tax=Ancylostoma ceylanicum TaxID=53326 RepID=A0A016UR85_9BILA|nr:hypothetical protein Y032_0030g2225 [Ancylostoma ceylanicum]
MAEDKKTITILLHRYDVPLINITYKNRKDLFRTFKKELKKHHLSIGEVSWADVDDGARSSIRNDDDLLGAVANSNLVRMYGRPKDGHRLFTPPNSDEEEEEENDAVERSRSTCKKAYEATKSAEDTKRISIKLYRNNLLRITITYKGKKDLFNKFQQKLKKHRLPNGEIYWGDWWENERILIRNADDLFGFVKDDFIVKMYYRRTKDNEPLACCSEGDHCRTRSPYPTRRVRRSQSSSLLPHSHPFYGQMPWNFAPWNFLVDPRLAQWSILIVLTFQWTNVVTDMRGVVAAVVK